MRRTSIIGEMQLLKLPGHFKFCCSRRRKEADEKSAPLINPPHYFGRHSFSETAIAKFLRVILLIGAWAAFCPVLRAADVADTNEIRIVEAEGKVEIRQRGAERWVLTQSNQVLFPLDQLRTGPRSRVALRWSDQSVLRFGPLTEIEIQPPHVRDSESGLHLIRGILSFFHRDKPGRIRVITSGALAGIEGTEFVMEVGPTNGTERTTLSVIDGRVRFENQFAALSLTNREQAVAEPGQPPTRTAGFIAKNLLQWCFYYPAVLDLKDLPLSTPEENALAESLAAYRSGDLLQALAKYPENRVSASDTERLYHAALLLSIGEVAETENELSKLSPREFGDTINRLAKALRTLIAAVKREATVYSGPLQPNENQLSTEFLAASYYEQSRAIAGSSLETALALARQAVAKSPEFGFGWERVAELEFSFGRTARASEALDKSLAISPLNAEALALKGFLLAAQNKVREASDWFDRAITVDSALGNAWLGRGLCRIRRGDLRGGREDLLIAAALEPQRAALRSYLAKAWSDSGDDRRAIKELQLAKSLDPNDPTAWLYSALVNEQDNRINEAIRDLEKSQELNTNRAVYRSQLLLDQDRAVRSANLARMYRDAGMEDVAFREAGRAVNSDYANYSAHYFLANSYNAMRDPRLVNLRFETAESTEYLLANLLSPAGVGVLSPTISQQEYSRLFDRDGLHVISETEYLSRGAWLQRGAQYGTFGNSSYSVEGFYRNDNGERPNSDLEQMQIALTVKQQLTPQDSAYVQASYFNDRSGDVAQRYDSSTASPTFRSTESQDGLINIGYHHEWNPGSHTLLLAGYLPDQFEFSDRNFPTRAVDAANPSMAFAYPDASVPNIPFGMAQSYRATARIYFVEAQQILQHNDRHQSIFGGRFQLGDIKVSSEQKDPTFFQPFFPPQGTPASIDNLTVDLKRWSFYGYHHWEIIDHLQLIGGLTYDHLEMPENFLYAPISNDTQTHDKFLPKAGLIWSPHRNTTLRFAYTRSLSGVTLEQSYRLEPAQVAGFTQAYRGVIPETAAGGPAPGAPFDTYDVSFEQELTPTTYLGLSGEILDSATTRTVGGYTIDPALGPFGVPSGLHQDLDYTEKSFAATLNQLAGRSWSFGATYRVTQSNLKQRLTEVADPFLPLINPSQSLESVLHQVSLDARFNHRSGVFARFNASWYGQSNEGFVPMEPGDNFWQFNLWAGYRFAHRKAEISVGLLNLMDHDYHLEPLTPYNELAHRRTVAVRLLINF
jgi:Flp pilus assembly protein TadD